jgi:hypothetical protein
MLLLCAALLSCGVDEKTARRDFYEDHPANHRITEVFTGEGDSEHAYVHIRYVAGDDGRVQEEVVLYRRTDGKWTLVMVVPPP